ncbi:ABC transporter substrate-binding protein [Paenibacillus spongiae]|uniref:Extracellular solute-binding protein n=1 Tax=Paenibacillus spongiae TaxID=2909671 RepID=A0ABY5S5Z0_9BACL|nr:hypothetical protein [Paenibacillus spongiae]UVI29336.1 hypothetical protein L1F29_28560 [Paenibacillus spongiae]
MKKQTMLMVMMALTIVLSGCAKTESTNTPASQVSKTENPNSAADMDKGGVKKNVVDTSGNGNIETINIKVMTPDVSAPARANNFIEAANSLNEKLEKENSKQRVQVEAIVKSVKDDEFKQQFIFASKSDNANDIYATGYSNIGWMANGDYLLPLTGIEKEPVFQNQMPGYWDAVSWNKQVWGVIQDTEARPIFFNKNVLKKLGWTDQQIADLPKKSENGEFTLADMTDLAKKAVDSKVVNSGLMLTAGGKDLPVIFFNHGTEVYDASQGKYVLDKSHLKTTFEYLNNAVSQGMLSKGFVSESKDDMLKTLINDEGLFLQAGVWDEAKWRTRGMHKVTGNVTSEYVMNNIGAMVMPVANKDQKPVTVSNPWVYVVSKDTKYPDLVKRLLVEVSAPKLQAEHGLQSSHIPFTKEGQQYETVKKDPWLNYVSYLTQYSKFMPNDPNEPKFEKIMKDATQNVVSGSMTTDEAVDWMGKQMKIDLGEVIEK